MYANDVFPWIWFIVLLCVKRSDHEDPVGIVANDICVLHVRVYFARDSKKNVLRAL